MLIEFFGLPGAGKSTMSRQVAAILLTRGIALDEITYDLAQGWRGPGRRLAKLVHLARYTAAHPSQAASCLARIVATRQTTAMDLGKSLFNGLFIASVAARRRSTSRVMLLDQGVAQALWSIGFAARREAWLDLLLPRDRRIIHAPDLIVQVRAGLRTIEDRLRARERRVSRLEDDLRGAEQALSRAEALGEAIIARFKMANVPVIVVDSDDAEQLASGAQMVARLVVAMLDERSVASGARPQRGAVPAMAHADSAEPPLGRNGGPMAEASPARPPEHRGPSADDRRRGGFGSPLIGPQIGGGR
jgi:AAA domain